MPMSPSQVEREAEELGLLYAELELLLLQLIANRLARDIDTPQWAGEQLAGVLAVRQALQSHVLRTQATSSGRLGTIITRAYMAGIDNAIDDLVEAGLDRSTLQRAHISPAQALIREAELRLRSTHMAILRQTEDVYRQAVAEGARPAVGGAETRRQATQRILNNLADRGVSGFVDKAGRKWELSTYAEMTARTALGRAAIQGFIETAAANGNDLVIVSDSPEECELCRPWEGRVLSISGKRAGRVTMAGGAQAPIAGSVAEATEAGLFHPNAVLGNQDVKPLGDVLAGVRAWYEGPSINVTLASGIQFTVSPNHPVLTARGWVTAEHLSNGDDLFRSIESDVNSGSGANEHFDNMPSRIEDVLDTLATNGSRARIPASRDDLHGDGKFCQGEIDVVIADYGLLLELNAYLSKEISQPLLMGANMQAEALSGLSTHDLCSVTVTDSVGRSLPNLDPGSLETAQYRLPGNADSPGDVLSGLPCTVAADQIINVKRDWYRGHAYDLQTGTATYLLEGIIVHNCTHRLTVFIEGATKPFTNTANPDGYEQRQQQRHIERQIRKWKRRQAVALDDQAKAAATAKVRQWQAGMRSFIDDTGRRRQYQREQITR